MSTDDGFLSRWSRRKTEARLELVEPVPAPVPETEPPQDLTAAPESPPPAEPPPTLADVALLGRDSDYSRFIAPGLDDNVKNAAMKKLFSDPHFNVMDGLDIYIDDYGKPDPIPLSMLRQMAQSAALGLFEQDEEKPPEALARPGTPDTELAETNDDPDLQLQQDDAAGRPGAGQGPGP